MLAGGAERGERVEAQVWNAKRAMIFPSRNHWKEIATSGKILSTSGKILSTSGKIPSTSEKILNERVERS